MDINKDNFYEVFEEMSGFDNMLTNCQKLAIMLDELSHLRTENNHLKERLKEINETTKTN